jgi:acyl-CoA synthetase (AMP-forming)/AMP-acid ligase II
MTDIASFRQAHFYEGNENYVSALPCSDFRTLLTTRRHQQEIYRRYYSGARVVRELSFARFCEAAFCLARRLHDAHGIRAGDRILVAMENSPLTLVAYAAILALGATIVPANPAEKGEFFEGIALDCGAVGMITKRASESSSAVVHALGVGDDG